MLFLAQGMGFEVNAKIVPYTLHIAPKTVTFSGEKAPALAINGTIPGPTITATVGDTLQMRVINHLNEPTSLHWHGVLVPNAMDGVPFVNQLPIAPGAEFVYQFPVIHSGTFWYHAHAGLQEQRGLYGAIVLHPQTQGKNTPEEHVLMMSDWTDENPEDVLAHIKKDPDYYALKKDAVHSWYKVLDRGMDAVKARFQNAWARMGPMDLSDIGYDAFLMNGQSTYHFTPATSSTHVKLRLINAAASSYFMVEYAGGPMTVIAADGTDVRPFTTKRLRMAMAETYDVLVPITPEKAYELRASSLDGTGHSSAFIGQGEKVLAPTYTKPDTLTMAMDHSSMTGHDMAAMDHNAHINHTSHDTPSLDVQTLNNYTPLRALSSTAFDAKRPVRHVTLKLTGSMERYVWTINGTPMYASDKIILKKGEVVRFTLINETMMDHPIHIHGHFFRVLGPQGDASPLKHTVSVSPHETVLIEMDANEDKDWIFHCHNLYHMKLGMGGVLHYAGSTLDPAFAHHGADHASEHGDIWFQATHLEAASNFSSLEAALMHGEDRFLLDTRKPYNRDYEVDARFATYISEFLGLYAGVRLQYEDDERKHHPLVGLLYTLPLLVEASMDVNTKGKVRLALANTHQLSDRLSFNWQWNSDHDYTLRLAYELNKTWSVSANYDKQERFGMGLKASF